MFDPKILLDQLTGAGRGAGTGPAGRGSGMGSGLGSGLGGGSLGGLAGQVLDMAQRTLGSGGTGVAKTGPGTGVAGSAGGGFLDTARDLMLKNPGMTTAVLGGLGAMVLKKGGIGGIAKLGGLALIGSLAYKAYQDHQAGQSPANAALPEAPAPAGSGFEAQAATDGTALLFIRAMIAAAMSDGQIDENERGVVLMGMREGGLDPEAADWLDKELASPASIDALAREATTPQLATQVYTAARITIDPDTAPEKRFLAGLAAMLGLDASLVAQLDATAEQAKRAA